MPRDQRSDETQPIDQINRVVWQALFSVVPSLHEGGSVRKPLESYLSQISMAILGPRVSELDDIIHVMHKARITDKTIAEVYVPILARRLGEDWNADRLDFSTVTIATARLQALVRRLDLQWEPLEGDLAQLRPACLVGVPVGTQHTLGASVLAARLRQRGVDVRLSLALTLDDMCEEMGDQSFAAVMLSVSNADSLGQVRDFVACVHKKHRNTKVLVGGTVLEHTQNVGELTRADLATSDLEEAIDFAGLTVGAHSQGDLLPSGEQRLS